MAPLCGCIYFLSNSIFVIKVMLSQVDVSFYSPNRRYYCSRDFNKGGYDVVICPQNGALKQSDGNAVACAVVLSLLSAFRQCVNNIEIKYSRE